MLGECQLRVVCKRVSLRLRIMRSLTVIEGHLAGHVEVDLHAVKSVENRRVHVELPTAAGDERPMSNAERSADLEHVASLVSTTEVICAQRHHSPSRMW